MVRFQEEYIEEIAAGPNYCKTYLASIVNAFLGTHTNIWMISFLISGEFPGVIMTIVLRRKIQYHLLQVEDGHKFNKVFSR